MARDFLQRETKPELDRPDTESLAVMRRRLLIFPAAGLAAAILWTTFGTFTTASGQQKSTVIARAHSGEQAPSFTKPIFLLMVGTDARNGNPTAGARTDAIHIVAIDPTTMR